MRNKFVSLILGLLVILCAPVVTSSCTGKAPASQTGENVGQKPMKLVEGQEKLVICAGVFSFAQVATEQEAPPGEATGVATVDEGDGLFSWQNILISILGIFATLFGALWKRARSALSAINDGLADGTLTKAEIAAIVKAWKGV